MQTITKILVALGVTLFLLTVGIKSEVKAQPCTSPWQHIVKIVTVDGCDYQVDLCVWCRVAYPGEVRVNSYRNIGPCSTTLNPAQIAQQIFTQLMNPNALFFDICQRGLPPCKNNPPLVIKLYTPICWKIKVEYIDPLDPENIIYVSSPCEDDAYCYSENEYCVDKHGVKHHTITNYMGYNFPPDCTLEGYEITIPTLLNQESDCFIVHTVCNP